MAVWKSVFLHEFLDGDPANLHAVPGELSVLPDGPVIGATPEPADRGFVVTPGRSLAYRFERPFQKVVGVDLSVDLLFPVQPNVPNFPLVSLAGGTVTLFLRQLDFFFVGPELQGRGRFALSVDGQVMEFDALMVPQQTNRIRVRWHTHGQVQVWQEGRLHAYEPGFAANRSLAIDRLTVGAEGTTPAATPRYLARRVYLKLLRRDDARHEIDRHVPIDVGDVPKDHCAERVRALHEHLLSLMRPFMAGVVSKLTTSWREGQTPGPFSSEAVAAHAAAIAAAEAFVGFLDTREEAAADAFLQQIGKFLDIVAAADPAGFAKLLADLKERSETVDPACRTALEPVFAANAEALEPLAHLLRTTWDRAEAALRGGPDA